MIEIAICDDEVYMTSEIEEMPTKKGRWHTLPHRARLADRPANL